MIRRLLPLLAAVWTFPVAAQPVSPDTVLVSLWGETLGTARAAADAVESALFDDSLATDADAREAAFRRGIVVASQAAAGAAAHVSATVPLAIAVAAPDRQAAVEAALAEPAVGLYEALLTVVVEARDLAGPTPGDATDRARWRERAAFVRHFADALADAVAALDR